MAEYIFLLKIYCQLLIYGLALQSPELSTRWCDLFESFQLFHTTIKWFSLFQRDPGLLSSPRTVIKAEPPLSSVSDEPQMSQEFRKTLTFPFLFIFLNVQSFWFLKAQHLFRTTLFCKNIFLFPSTERKGSIFIKPRVFTELGNIKII